MPPRRRGLLAAVGGLAVAVGLTIGVVAACSSSENGAGNNTNFVQEPPGFTQYAVSSRKAAPDLAGGTLTGDNLSLKSLRGKVVVVNFWGSWCAPCRAESPALVQVAGATASKGVTFLGVDERDTKTNARSFDRGHGVTYPSLFDEDGSLAVKWPGANGPPYTFVIDRQGRIAARILGGVTPDELQTAVVKVAAEA